MCKKETNNDREMWRETDKGRTDGNVYGGPSKLHWSLPLFRLLKADFFVSRPLLLEYFGVAKVEYKQIATLR